jgi:hypothetical protein
MEVPQVSLRGDHLGSIAEATRLQRRTSGRGDLIDVVAADLLRRQSQAV